MGAGFQVPDSERAQDSMENCRVLWCIPTPGLSGILNQVGLCVLVYCSFIIVCHLLIELWFL